MILLLRRSLRHHAPARLAAAAGVAVATAIIVAALLVGAAMRGSLHQRALQRLGPVTHLISPPHGLSLAATTSGLAGGRGLAHGGQLAVPVLAADGACAEDGGAEVPRVRLVGVDADWVALRFAERLPAGDGCLVSRGLSDALGLAAGEEIVVTVERVRGAADGTLFAQHRRDRRLATLRLTVLGIVEANGIGHCAPWRDLPPGPLRAVWLDRKRLADAVGAEAYASDLLFAGWDPAPLAAALRASATPMDLGLRIRGPRIEAVDLLLDPAVAAAVPQARRESVYLADRIVCGPRSASYAMVAALDPFPAGAAAPGEEGIVLDRWLADDLAAAVGDRVELHLPVPDGSGGYPLTTLTVRVEGIVATGGPWTDRDLIPLLPGITDADDLAHWDAPFPVELARVTTRDDLWWAQHRAAPKAFLHPRQLERLWQRAGGRGRWLTGLTVAGAEAPALARQVVQVLAPTAAGFAPQPVRDEALAAAGGSTDLGGLFLGLGSFIVVAGLGLAAVIIRLDAVKRAGEAGALRACGWSAAQVRRLLALEGAITAVVGALIGTALGWSLAGGLLYLLAGPWAAAGGGVHLQQRLDAVAFTAGGAAGAVLGVAVAWWASGLLARRPILDLLAGWRAERLRRPAPASRRVLVLLLVGILLALVPLAGWHPATAGVAGVGLLLAGLGGLRLLLSTRPATSRPTLGRLLRRSLAAAPLRALASAGLAAVACFVLVAVAAQRRQAVPDQARDGGFQLVVETTAPLGYDLATAAGRRRLGFTDTEQGLFGRAIGLLVAPGDGISCLQADRPLRPRLVGWPAELHDWPPPDGGWAILAEPGDDTPAVADADSAQWILRAPPGTRLPYDAAHLRMAGVLPAGSILAGDVLVAPERLLRLRPDARRTRWLVASADPAAAALILRRRLSPYGAEVTPTADLIAAVGAVRTAYLDAFLALGGVGLALAVLGLAALVLRSAEERRWEGALLSALGVTRRRWALLLAGEQALLLAAGLVIGAVAALLASGPGLLAPGASVAWGAVGGILGGVLLLGTLLSMAGGWWGARRATARTLAEAR